MRRKHQPGCPCCDPVIECPTTLTVRVRPGCSNSTLTLARGVTVTASDVDGVLPDVTATTATSGSSAGVAVLVLDNAGGTFDVTADHGYCVSTVEGVVVAPCERKTIFTPPCCAQPLFTTLTTPWGTLNNYTRSEFTFNPEATRTELWFPVSLAVCSGYGSGGGAYVNFQMLCLPGVASPDAWRIFLRAVLCSFFDLSLPDRPAPGLGQFGQPSGITPQTPVFAEAAITSGTCDPLNLTFEITQINNAVTAADFGIALGDELVWTP
jgi:hypothetical protein